MPAIITQDIRVHNASQFRESLGEAANTVLYTFIGQPASINVTAEPDTIQNQYDIWDNMISLKRIADGDASIVIPRYNWTSGNAYVAFRPDSNTLVNTQFYVMNDQFEVFKCLANAGGGVSTVKPEATLPSVTGNTTVLADGYRWKYMYTVSAPDATKFMTNAFIPVSNDAAVQAQAVDGGILHIEIQSGGGGYVSAPNVIIAGDGSGAIATATVNAGELTAITITNPGSGYRFANVHVSAGNASLLPIIGPHGGHGSNAAQELFGKYVMVNSKFEPTDPKIPIPLTFQQIGIVQDPFVYGSNSVIQSTSVRAYKILTLDAPADSLVQGDTITGSATGANAYVLKGEGSNVLYIQTKDVSSNLDSTFKTFTTSDTIAGVGTVTAVTPPEVQPDSGRIIYVDNRNAITRSAEQTESVHIVLEF